MKQLLVAAVLACGIFAGCRQPEAHAGLTVFGAAVERGLVEQLAPHIDKAIRPDGGWGTGFAVRGHGMMTAGHVAKNWLDLNPVVLRWRGADRRPIRVELDVDVALYDYGSALNKDSVCVAAEPLAVGEKCWMIGWPGDIQALTSGYCIDRNTASYFAYNGASGAPVVAIRDGRIELVGVHVSGESHQGFRLPISHFVPLPEIRAFLGLGP